MTNVQLDNSLATYALMMLFFANNKGYRSDSSANKRAGDDELQDYLIDVKEQWVPRICYDRKRKLACKNIAELALSKTLFELEKAKRTGDYSQLRKEVGDGVNKVLEISLGPEVFGIIMEGVNPAIASGADPESEDSVLEPLLAVTGHRTKEKLLERGYFKGRLEPLY